MAKIDKKPDPFDFFGHNVYSANDLLDYDPNYFFGCAAGIRKIIEKKKIPDTEYFFGSPSKAGWKKCTASYPKGKLLLKVDWVHENIPKMAINNDIHYDIEPAPEILYLDDNEMFKDNNGKPLDIEVRGERNPKKCYFKVSDVSRNFEMENLQTTLQHKEYGYVQDIHYKTFTTNIIENKHDQKTKTTIKKSLFLTYTGMIRVLFCSRNKNAESFQEWATEKLFTIQMGTNDMKDELVADIKGVTSKVVKSMFAKTGSFPCVYLYKLNTVKEVRDSKIFPVSDTLQENTIICKYGQTEDFERRTKEHERDYGKMNGVKMELLSFSYIDPKYVSEAEVNLRNFFNDFGMKVDIDGRSEIVAIPDNLLKQVKQRYDHLGSIYAGRNTEMVIQLAEWKNKYELLKERYDSDIFNIKKENEYIINTMKMTLEMKETMYKTELESKEEKYKLEIQLRDERIASLEKVRDLEHKLLKAQGITL